MQFTWVWGPDFESGKGGLGGGGGGKGRRRRNREVSSPKGTDSLVRRYLKT